MYGNNYYPPRYGGIGVPTQPVQQPQFNQPIQNIQQTPATINSTGLQGKVVDSIDVVKAMDIPLDGSVSFFPLTDGTAIVSKKLQSDGTSKMIIYKPVDEEKQEVSRYATFEEMNELFNSIDLSDIDDLKDELKDLKKELKKLKKKKSD